MSVLLFVLNMMFTPTLLYQLLLDRDADDVKHGLKSCINDEHSTGLFDCACNADFPTVMSRDNDPFFCRATWQMGCHFMLLESTTKPRTTAKSTIASATIVPRTRTTAKSTIASATIVPRTRTTAKSTIAKTKMVPRTRTIAKTTVAKTTMVPRTRTAAKTTVTKTTMVPRTRTTAKSTIAQTTTISRTRKPARSTIAKTTTIPRTLAPPRSVVVKLDRDEKDVRYGFAVCLADSHASGWFGTCTCDTDYNTIMSSNGKAYKCMDQTEIGCQHSLLGSNRTYLIHESSFTKEIHPTLPKHIDTSVYRIFVWNVGESGGIYGQWYDVTNHVLGFFHVRSKYQLEISNLDMNLWKGQLIKIEFGAMNETKKHCLTMKIKGTRKYPFSMKELKADLPNPKPLTTRTPTVVTTSSQPTKSTSTSPLPTSVERTKAGTPVTTTKKLSTTLNTATTSATAKVSKSTTTPKITPASTTKKSTMVTYKSIATAQGKDASTLTLSTIPTSTSSSPTPPAALKTKSPSTSRMSTTTTSTIYTTTTNSTMITKQSLNAAPILSKAIEKTRKRREATSNENMLTESGIIKRIHPHLPRGIDGTIYQISIWNLIGKSNEGKWYDITYEVRNLFKLLQGQQFQISSLNMTLWKGQLIRITFGVKKEMYKPCMIVKVKGRIEYPFDLDSFLSHFPRPPTTTSITTTVLKETTRPTTTRKPTFTTSVPTTLTTGLPSTTPFVIKRTMMVHRKINDVKWHIRACMDSRSTGSYYECTCKSKTSTVMSRDAQPYLCKASWEIGCHYSLFERNSRPRSRYTKPTHLLTESGVDRHIYPALHSKQIDGTIFKIHVWNLRSYAKFGHWHDITKEASPFFHFKSNNQLRISKLNTSLWEGHLIKITFGVAKPRYKPCLAVKIPGIRVYPYIFNKFIRKLQQQPTTRPTLSTTEVSTKAGTGSATRSPLKDEESTRNICIALGLIIAILLAALVFVVRKNLLRKRKNKSQERKGKSETKMDDVYNKDNKAYIRDPNDPNEFFNGAMVHDRASTYSESDNVTTSIDEPSPEGSNRIDNASAFINPTYIQMLEDETNSKYLKIDKSTKTDNDIQNNAKTPKHLTQSIDFYDKDGNFYDNTDSIEENISKSANESTTTTKEANGKVDEVR